jgi:tetratricopeptide (TPR) repeat protein
MAEENKGDKEEKLISKSKEPSLKAALNSFTAFPRRIFEFLAILPRLFLLLALILVVIVTFHEIRTDIFIIEPFEVPSDLAAQGLTGRAVVNKLVDEMNLIIQKANANPQRETFSSITVGTEETLDNIDIPGVPGAQASLKALSDYIKKSLFNRQSTRVKGEIFKKDNKLYLTIRIVGKPHENLSPLEMQNMRDINELDKTMLRAALYVYKHTQPYLIALFLYENDKGGFEQEINGITNLVDGTNNKGRKELASLYNLWGRYLQEKSPPDYEGTIEKYKKTTEIDPEFAVAYYSWGNVLASMGKYDEAVDKYKKSAEINPGDPTVYYSWGNVLINLTRYNEAIEKCRKTTEIDPKFALAYYSWGNALASLRRYDEAVEKYKKAAELNPDDPTVYYSWGNVLINLTRYDEAIEKYKKTTELDPEFALAYYSWGNALSSMGKYDEAVEKYQKAAQIEPDNNIVYYGLGNALSKQGKYDKAIEQYDRVVKSKSIVEQEAQYEIDELKKK